MSEDKVQCDSWITSSWSTHQQCFKILKQSVRDCVAQTVVCGEMGADRFKPPVNQATPRSVPVLLYCSPKHFFFSADVWKWASGQYKLQFGHYLKHYCSLLFFRQSQAFVFAKKRCWLTDCLHIAEMCLHECFKGHDLRLLLRLQSIAQDKIDRYFNTDQKHKYLSQKKKKKPFPLTHSISVLQIDHWDLRISC